MGQITAKDLILTGLRFRTESTGGFNKLLRDCLPYFFKELCPCSQTDEVTPRQHTNSPSLITVMRYEKRKKKASS